MQVYKRICLEDYTLCDEKGTTFTLKRGTEYLTSRVLEDKKVMVFTTYWVRVPVHLFGGAVPL